MAGDHTNHQPSVEDYDSDHDSVVQGFRQSPAPGGQANVAMKRSHHSDLGSDKPPAQEKVGNIDLQSDSGYSSHTAATMSSADSAPSAKSQRAPPAPSPPSPPVSAPASTAATAGTPKRRPTLSSRDDRHSSASTNTTGGRRPARSGSVAARPRPPKGDRDRAPPAVVDCTDPNCRECVPQQSRGRRPKPSAADSGLDMTSLVASLPPLDTRSQHSDPAPATSYTSPPSPAYPRMPDAYRRGQLVMQPAVTPRPRRPSEAARPQSYAGGEIPPGYWVPGMQAPPAMMGSYQGQPHEHGPPPANSAYHNPYQMNHAQMNPHMNPQMGAYGGMFGATPPNNYYAPPAQAPGQYGMQQPPMPAQNSDNIFNARRSNRPTSTYGPLLVTQAREPSGNTPAISARYPSTTPASATQRELPAPQFDESSESESSEEEEEERNSRALMRPPAIPQGSTKRRPSIRPSGMSQSATLDPPRDRDRQSRAPRITTTAMSRSGSISHSRPNLVQHPQAQSAVDTTVRTMVENPRRQSYQSTYRAERPSSKVYQEVAAPLSSRRRNIDSTKYHDQIEPPGHRRHKTDDLGRRPTVYHTEATPLRVRRQTEANIKRGDENIGQSSYQEAEKSVEEYMQRTRGGDSPFIDQVHKDAKRQSQMPNGQSHTGSRRSRGSDEKSRYTNMTSGGNGEIRLRVDASAPIALQFKGDMEGRTLQINPAEDGMADIVIGGNRNENTYRSERGSVYDSRDARTLVSRSDRSERARREVEDASIRSTLSSQSRREREQGRDRGGRDGEPRQLRRRPERPELRYD